MRGGATITGMSSLSYKTATSILAGALRFGMNPSLGTITEMCKAMGDPQRRFECVQVAGTNGKSSVARFTAAMLSAHGLRVGLYTSPHLVSYEERIEVDGKVVSRALFAEGISAALDAARVVGSEVDVAVGVGDAVGDGIQAGGAFEAGSDAAGAGASTEACAVGATEFELLTAAALHIFAREGVDVAVLECGLGGRWDATTVCDARVAVVTGIALDHTAVLGDTLAEIAAEKACIIKPHADVVLADGIAARGVFERRAAEVGARIVDAYCSASAAPAACDGAPLRTRLNGGGVPSVHQPSDRQPLFQQRNIDTALAAAKSCLAARGIAFDEGFALDAVQSLSVPGRFEVLRDDPLLIVDAAHNPQSAGVLAAAVDAMRDAGDGAPEALLLGVLADKDARGIAGALAGRFGRVVVCASPSPRALAPDELADIVCDVTGVRPQVVSDVAAALAVLEGTSVLATGSVTIAGEVKRIFS